MIKHSKRLDRITEYYFSKKLREVRSLIDQGQDIINLGIGSPDLKPPKSSLENLTKALNDKNANKYQSYNGIELFRREISNFYQSYFNVKLNPKLIYFFAISGLIAIRFSLSRFSEIEDKFIIKLNYDIIKEISPLKLKLR